LPSLNCVFIVVLIRQIAFLSINAFVTLDNLRLHTYINIYGFSDKKEDLSKANWIVHTRVHSMQILTGSQSDISNLESKKIPVAQELQKDWRFVEVWGLKYCEDKNFLDDMIKALKSLPNNKKIKYINEKQLLKSKK
jgi:hypothetical protein